MSNGIAFYTCPEQLAWLRSLQSDDEAAVHWARNRNYVPNYSFERYWQCVPGICAGGNGEWTFYWSYGGNWVRVYDAFPALDGAFYMKSTGAGYIRNRVLRKMCNGNACVGTLTFGLNNRSATPASVRVIVRDVGISPSLTLYNSTCTGAPMTWVTCSASFSVQAWAALHAYEYEIKNETPGQFWIDYVQVRDSSN